MEKPLNILWACDPRKGYWAVSAILKMDDVVWGMQVAAQVHIPFTKVDSEQTALTVFGSVIAEMTTSIEHKARAEKNKLEAQSLAKTAVQLTTLVEYENGEPIKVYRINQLQRKDHIKSLMRFEEAQQKISINERRAFRIKVADTADLYLLPDCSVQNVAAFYREIAWCPVTKRFKRERIK